jgi:hypothetical protein
VFFFFLFSLFFFRNDMPGVFDVARTNGAERRIPSAIFFISFFRPEPVEQEYQSALAEAAAKMLRAGVVGTAGGADTGWRDSRCHTRGEINAGKQRSLAGREESSRW